MLCYQSNYSTKSFHFHPRLHTVRELEIHQKDILLPNFSEMTLRNAKIKIIDLGLNLNNILYEFNPQIKNGYISFQTPSKGKLIKSGSLVSLGVSKGSPPDYFIVPDLINYSFFPLTMDY